MKNINLVHQANQDWDRTYTRKDLGKCLLRPQIRIQITNLLKYE